MAWFSHITNLIQILEHVILDYRWIFFEIDSIMPFLV